MLIIGVLLLAGAALMAATAGGVLVLPGRGVQKRVRMLAAPEAATESAWKRIRSDVSADGLFARLTAPTLVRRIERNIVLAGRPVGWTLQRIIVLKPAGAAVGLFFAVVIVSKWSSPFVLLVALAVIVLGYFVPDLLIYNRGVKRQEEMQKTLPDLLDQIVISIEAGVGFEQALIKVAEVGEGPLVDEFVRLLQDVSLGMSRRDAYTALADRTSVDDVRGFAKSIVQAEEYGISVASVVRSQAKEMRLARRMRAEARAQKVPVKILIPLMVCVLPVLFIIVLAPSVVTAYASNG
ncbi:type II secretion system F family protein [Aeromicrobium fastidiosum]|uniref:Type II secretion system F family protein n=1 Tax=Aeromicrobium fastidiosum TaxID=52699 RepID=A0A641ANK6_9ACTN|nr:type II secretion system F family protein [Aeromicrobium fastidiosum]KAA1379666.1 type II secretion system F family protein [Aeromicrobium fastidiosum]MBP2389141.1 tight adherence protein C [Aeromicrobium fastidiosum]